MRRAAAGSANGRRIRAPTAYNARMDREAINQRTLALRAEIAEIRYENEAYQRRSGHNGPAIGAHEERRARLVQIMDELARLSRQLGRGLPERESDRLLRSSATGPEAGEQSS